MMKLLLYLSLALMSLTSLAADRIQPGHPAPDFELSDQNGKPRRLSNLLQEKPVALVFSGRRIGVHFASASSSNCNRTTPAFNRQDGNWWH